MGIYLSSCLKKQAKHWPRYDEYNKDKQTVLKIIYFFLFYKIEFWSRGDVKSYISLEKARLNIKKSKKWDFQAKNTLQRGIRITAYRLVLIE